MNKSKTFTIVTFGCRTNQAESRMIGEELCRMGFDNQGDQGNWGDLVIINSCEVTAKAEKEVRQTIRKIKRENPECFLVVTGCLAENYRIKNQESPASLRRSRGRARIKNLINLIVKNKDKERVGEVIRNRFKKFKSLKGLKNKYQDKYSKSFKALIKIQEGCDNFCTYCIVPYLRGEPKSVPLNKILSDINRLVKLGIKEIVLTATDMGGYKPGLIELLKLIKKETKVKKISFGSINFSVFDNELINFISDNKIICRHFHIPLQSGCSKTLKRMARGYKVEDYQSKIQELKVKIPEFSLSMDIIVGFPGETDKEFEESLRSLKGLRCLMGKKFTKAHIFRYSSREGTAAAKMLGKKGWKEVDSKTKKERFLQVKKLLEN